MAVLCLTSGARPTGLFPMQNLTDDNRMTLAADAYARHHCAGRSVVEIIDRVLVFMDETVRAAAEGRAEIAAYRLAVSQCVLALRRQVMVETKSDVHIAGGRTNRRPPCGPAPQLGVGSSSPSARSRVKRARRGFLERMPST
jgi:hypothetical protein